jgi:hypothetical protein
MTRAPTESLTSGTDATMSQLRIENMNEKTFKESINQNHEIAEESNIGYLTFLTFYFTTLVNIRFELELEPSLPIMFQ